MCQLVQVVGTEASIFPAGMNLPHVEFSCSLDRVRHLLRMRHGLDVSCYSESFLAQTIETRRQVTAGETLADYLDQLAENPAEAEEFADSLRISYSKFFRNPITFALLEQWILPSFLREAEKNGPSEIRVWSAGCAAGQEAYSIAILLDQMTVVSGKPLPYRIFGTDWSEACLALARNAVYSTEAVENVRWRQLREYFVGQGSSMAIASKLRTRVDFSLYDLLDKDASVPPASIYGGFNLVFCSNVLLYYRPEKQRFILDRLWRSLASGGFLVTDETERQIVESAGGFDNVAMPTALFQKNFSSHG